MTVRTRFIKSVINTAKTQPAPVPWARSRKRGVESLSKIVAFPRTRQR